MKLFNFFKKREVENRVDFERVFLDYASASPVLPEVLDEVARVARLFPGNPSSLHQEGEVAKEYLDTLRKRVAKHLRAQKSEVFFVSGSTEANALFTRGTVEKCMQKGETVHVITSAAEHPSLLAPVQALEKRGAEVTYLVPDEKGVISVEDIKNAVTPNTKLIALSSVHSESGARQRVREIALTLSDYAKRTGLEKPLFYIDATQALEYDTVDVGTLLCDGMTFGGRKIGALGGVGVLFKKHSAVVDSTLSGGGQEKGLRGGTENLPLISGLVLAIDMVLDKTVFNNRKKYVADLRSYTIEKLQDLHNPRIHIIGDSKVKHAYHDREIVDTYFTHAAPHILLIQVDGILGEELLLRLDARGVAVSTASACSIEEGSGAKLLLSRGFEKEAKQTIRLSFSHKTTKSEIDVCIKNLQEILEKY